VQAPAAGASSSCRCKLQLQVQASRGIPSIFFSETTLSFWFLGVEENSMDVTISHWLMHEDLKSVATFCTQELQHAMDNYSGWY